MTGKTIFLKKRVSEYSKAGVGNEKKDNVHKITKNEINIK
jgi:hypothetical protein